ncbi:hypothetical protein GWK47_036564 [Chionoecetes opilio]|uniref:Uncharacterized protein n=1 Tax=Chionoecetes opilio TaxID=41210 RepID=A0A8J4YRA7_CHIOP|nr:hypothetical protein GWK47_036564 [Chionoecetes opilio]
MNRWANNYYAQESKDPTPSQPQPHPPPTTHSRPGSTIKTGNNGTVNLCVFRVAHLTHLTLRSLIEHQGVGVLYIEQLSHKAAGYRSFVVTVEERDAPRLLSRSFWPGLVSCRLLQDADPRHNVVFSRRHARELSLPITNKDEEIMLGVRVLAHCARAEGRANKLQELVFKICQPQVVFLIKQFTRTIEEKHIWRAERYFWDLGEFLDQYIVHSLFIHGMLSLFTTCTSKILTLKYRKYVSDDLVKVYRGMQTKMFASLP